MGVSSVRRRYRRYYRDPTTDKRLPPKKKPPDRNQRTTSPNNARQISRLECEVQRRFVRHVLQYRRGTARIKAGKRASSLPWYKVRARANQRHDFYRPIGTTPPQQRGARLKHLRKAPPSKHLHQKANGIIATFARFLLWSYLPIGYVRVTQIMQFLSFLFTSTKASHQSYKFDLHSDYDFTRYSSITALLIPLTILIIFGIKLQSRQRYPAKPTQHRPKEHQLKHSLF